MTLSEIETILEDLSKRHSNLDKELLTTILLSAGWENKFVRDAGILFDQKKKDPSLTISSQSTPEKPQEKVAETQVEQIEKKPEIEPSTIQTEPSKEKVSSPLVPQVVQQPVPIAQGVSQPALEATKVVPPTPSENLIPVSQEDITFYDHDGAEEDLVIHQDVQPQKRVEAAPLIEIITRQEVPVVPIEPVVTVESSPKKVATPIPSPNFQPPKKAGFSFSKIFRTQIIVPTLHSSTPHPVETVVTLKQPEVRQAPVQEQVKEEVENEPLITIALTSLQQKQPEKPTEPKKEPESLIIHEELPLERPTSASEIPDNLPLLPFESSPHVWSFSKYKETFHGETMPSKEVSQEPAIKLVITKSVPESALLSKPAVNNDDEEISLEKTPLTRGDESLVFLAGVMLLVIILILGYMYSNGRL